LRISGWRLWSKPPNCSLPYNHPHTGLQDAALPQDASLRFAAYEHQPTNPNPNLTLNPKP